METLLSRNIDYFGLKHFGCVIDPNCEDIIMSSWDTLQWGTPMFRLTQKIKAVKDELNMLIAQENTTGISVQKSHG